MRKPASLLAVLFVLLTTACAEFKDAPDLSPYLVNQAVGTVERFKAKEDWRTFVPMLDTAQAVMVFPALYKAGLFGAAEGGSGVLIARKPDGTWGYPAFYTLGAASVGLQLGIQSTEMVLIIRTPDALEAVLKHQGKLGAEVGITVGTMGGGAEASTTTNMGADSVAFVNATIGAFGGASLEGAVLARRNDLNQAYYGQTVTPADIVRGGLSNPQADKLRRSLTSR